MSYLEELLPEFRKGAKIRKAEWSKRKFIVLKNCVIVNSGNYEYPLSIHEILSNQRELYQEPEPDWNYIIKNKCLCWFWDDNSIFGMRLGYLTKLMSDFPNKKEFAYCKDNGGAFKYCRPVCRDEVAFYEDRKD